MGPTNGQTTGRWSADRAGSERPRFYPRQVVGPDDLTQILDHLRARQRRHNRGLHGWGIVWGAEVKQPKPDEAVLTIAPGFILAPSGDEIEFVRELKWDVSKGLIPASPNGDPWASDVVVPREPNTPLYLAVRYAERATRHVRAAPAACGCGETDCEASAYADTYEFGLLEELPESHDPKAATDLSTTVVEAIRTDPPQPPKGLENVMRVVHRLEKTALVPPAPPTPTGRWVVLATLRFKGGVLTAPDDNTPAVDMTNCRRHVVTVAPLWWQPS